MYEILSKLAQGLLCRSHLKCEFMWPWNKGHRSSFDFDTDIFPCILLIKYLSQTSDFSSFWKIDFPFLHGEVNLTLTKNGQTSIYTHHLNKLRRPRSLALVSRFWRRFLKGFYHIWAWWPSWSKEWKNLNKLLFLQSQEAKYKIWF